VARGGNIRAKGEAQPNTAITKMDVPRLVGISPLASVSVSDRRLHVAAED
jgi:hypothetical protein